MTTLIGQEFGGYRIISQVGKAGMATVYKAFQSSLDRYVAVKVMPLLTDFGLAKIVGGSQLTITGTIAGTPAYMSPEQGQGEPVDSRSDIYSLGIVLYEMATGRVPYHAETPMAVVVKHIIEALPLPRSINPSLPEEIERVILKALAKRPKDRYQRVKDMSNALMEACENVAAPRILKETVIEDVAMKPPHPGVEEVSVDEQEISQVPTEPAPEEPPFVPIPSAPFAEPPVMVPTSTPPAPFAAIVEFEAAIGLGSEDLDMYFTLADSYFALNNNDEAVRVLENAVAIGPNEVWVHESAGWLYQELGTS